jgi:hypothetical protein
MTVNVPVLLHLLCLQCLLIGLLGADGMLVISRMLSGKTSIKMPVKLLPAMPPLSTKTVISFPFSAGSCRIIGKLSACLSEKREFND